MENKLVDAAMRASRAVVGVAARSLAALPDDVSLPQFRVLVLLTTRGPQRPIDLAAALGVNPSSATRLIERLTQSGFIWREPISGDRLSYRVHLSKAGCTLVDEVWQQRREGFEQMLANLPEERHDAMIEALQAIADAAGEPPECTTLGLGWLEPVGYVDR